MSETELRHELIGIYPYTNIQYIIEYAKQFNLWSDENIIVTYNNKTDTFEIINI